jgi:hypothetical protein
MHGFCVSYDKQPEIHCRALLVIGQRGRLDQTNAHCHYDHCSGENTIGFGGTQPSTTTYLPGLENVQTYF